MRAFLHFVKNEKLLPVVVSVAFFARLVYSFFIFPKIGDALYWRGVDDGYDEIARNMLGGHGFVMMPGRPENLLIPPGYAYFLAGLYSLFGVEMAEGARLWIAQAALDALTCGALFAAGALIVRDRRAGLLAAGAWALYPQMVVYSARIAPEVLFTFLFFLLFAAWHALETRGGAGRALLAGAAWGALVLTKEKVILLPALLLARLAWVRLRGGSGGSGSGGDHDAKAHGNAPAPVRARGGVSRLAIEGAVFVVAALVVTGPWLVRGYRLTGGLVPIMLRGGRALDQGMKKDIGGADTQMVDGFERFYMVGGGRNPTFDTLSVEEREEQIRNMSAREASRLEKTLGEIARAPLTFLRRTAVRAVAYWYWGQPRVVLGNALINLPLLLLAIAGYWLSRRTSYAAIAALLVLYMNAIHAMTVVRMRYSLPVMTLIMLLAAVAVVAAWERRRGAGSRR